jgi:hypothetical protein
MREEAEQLGLVVDKDAAEAADRSGQPGEARASSRPCDEARPRAAPEPDRLTERAEMARRGLRMLMAQVRDIAMIKNLGMGSSVRGRRGP